MDSLPPQKPGAPPKSGFFTARNAGENDAYETIKTIVIAIVVALVFRSFFYEPFHIPSDSMKSNLLVGDYLFVSKFSYGYSRFSFPFSLPFFKGRVFRSDPQRGDIVVFRPPGMPDTDFIKRLIGLPGDRIQMKDGVLYINDKAVPKEYRDDWVDTTPHDKKGPITYKRYQETLPEGKSYLMMNMTPMSEVEDTDVYVVPEGHYFMMGDNRDDSRDSRFPNPVGFVPEENLIGRADLILFSWACTPLCADRFFLKLP